MGVHITEQTAFDTPMKTWKKIRHINRCLSSDSKHEWHLSGHISSGDGARHQVDALYIYIYSQVDGL